ncbi:MAG: hypothetical protein EOM59_09315 [Clostridia bacterium]|nr:hypothetical protein [Clostridia bacterium]
MDNKFINLINTVNEKKWCVKLFCTTCGCGFYRDELKRIGYEELLKEMSELKLADVQHLNQFEDCINLAAYIMRSQINAIPYAERPEIVNYIDNKVQQIMQRDAARRKEQENKQIAEHLAVQERKSKIYQAHVQSSYEATKHWRDMFVNFESKSIESKLMIIADDTIHTPDYYPLDLRKVDIEIINNLDQIVLDKLILKFASYKKKAWRNFYNMLILAAEKPLEKSTEE